MKKRLLSALVLLLIYVPVFISGGIVFSMAMGVTALLAFKEILNLKVSHNKIPAGIELMGMLALLFIVFYEYQSTNFSYGIGYRTLSVMLIAFLVPTMFHHKNGEYETKDAFYILGAIILLGTAFNFIIILRNVSMYQVLYLFLITTCTDLFAYLFGSLMGRHPLALSISPHKTVEGAIGGLIMGTAIPIPFYMYFINNENVAMIIFMTFVISLFSQIGDLLFSKIKRENDIKDFSNMIPGHGGILDRFDSTIFAVLSYVLLLILL